MSSANGELVSLNGTKRRATSYDFEEEESTAPSSNKFHRGQPSYAAYRRRDPGKLNAERGQILDFKQELHYLLSTIFDDKATQNLKNLSLIQLVKKAVSPQFRNFLRSQSVQLERLFGVLCEFTNSQIISLSATCLLYLMARDQRSVPISENCFRLLSELLKPDLQRVLKTDDQEYKEHCETMWSFLNDWRISAENRTGKSIQFDVTVDNLSCSYLALDSLAYIAISDQSSLFKSNLLNSGCLATIVAKLDKVLLELIHSTTEVIAKLKIIERCFRILENAAAFDKKNQVFLIQHRNCLLIFSCAKFLNFASKFFENCQSSEHNCSQDEGNQIFECVCLLCRVLMNISHENENASIKIGQIAGFLGNCLAFLASHSQSAPKIKFFDICCMMYGLLVNLLEKCPANRRKFISLRTTFMESDGKNVMDMSSLEILTKLFIKHDSSAKTVDEELDNDLLAAEEPDDEEQDSRDGNDIEDSNNGNGKALHRDTSMSEDEIIAAIQLAMNKASAHMEDSMMASYCSLVIAILVGSDEKLAVQLKGLLPDGEVKPMIEQLERFLEFMQITKKLKENTVRSLERLIKSFELITSLN